MTVSFEAPAPRSDAPDGFAVVLKPPGMTSHDVVQFARRALGTPRVGHAGTLDPAAAGVLIVGVGRGLKLLEYVGGGDKTYRGELVLGVATDTGDGEGVVLDRASASRVTNADVARAMAALTGEIDQVPPAYSAIKIGGEPLYRKARRGEAVTAPARKVTVRSLVALGQVSDGDVCRVRFEVRCSKGTYVRSLCVDLGALVGVPAHLGFLVRVRAEPFGLEDATALEDLGAASLLPLLAAVPDWPRARLTPAGRADVGNGRWIAANDDSKISWEARPATEGVPIALLGEDDSLFAVGRKSGDGTVRPVKLIARIAREAVVDDLGHLL
jgi:tRNA pseudouridine55 synthase